MSILIVLLVSCANVSFALDNDTDIQSGDMDVSNQHYDKSVLLISDNGGTNIFDSAATEILKNYSNVDIQVRSSDQISTMNEEELYFLFNKSDIVIVNWLTTDADSVLTNTLPKATAWLFSCRRLESTCSGSCLVSSLKNIVLIGTSTLPPI